MPVIEHFVKLPSVKIIQIVSVRTGNGVFCVDEIIGLGDDGELYNRFIGRWCLVDPPKDTSQYNSVKES